MWKMRIVPIGKTYPLSNSLTSLMKCWLTGSFRQQGLDSAGKSKDSHRSVEHLAEEQDIYEGTEVLCFDVRCVGL